MKQLIVAGKDLSELLPQITWSGDTKQVARQLAFSIVQKDTDKFLPDVDISEGSEVVLQEDGEVLFGGIVFDIEKSASGTVTCTAFDLMFYINNSEISEIFDAAPEVIANQVCTGLGVPFGGAVATGINVYVPCLGKAAYEAIMMAYTAASRQNGKKYLPVIRNINQVCVIEKGTPCGVTLDGTDNLMDASYKTSLQNAVNQVLITDKSGAVTGKVQDEKSPLPGTVQRIYKQEDGKDAATEAKALLQGLEQSASVTAFSDVRAVAGMSIIVREPVSGLRGLFYIEADSHTFGGAKDEMQLTLAFQNMMDEKEIEKDNTEK